MLLNFVHTFEIFFYFFNGLIFIQIYTIIAIKIWYIIKLIISISIFLSGKMNVKKKYTPFVTNRTHQINYIDVQKSGYNFRSRIGYNGKYITICSSDDALECANAYDKYIVDNNMPGKNLNFPDKYPDYDKLLINTLYENIKGNNNIIRLICNSCPDAHILIDREDYDKIKYYSWNIANGGYVCTNVNNQFIRIHRLIMNITEPNVYIDHIDKNKLYNTKNNLRISNDDKILVIEQK